MVLRIEDGHLVSSSFERLVTNLGVTEYVLSVCVRVQFSLRSGSVLSDGWENNNTPLLHHNSHLVEGEEMYVDCVYPCVCVCHFASVRVDVCGWLL